MPANQTLFNRFGVLLLSMMSFTFLSAQTVETDSNSLNSIELYSLKNGSIIWKTFRPVGTVNRLELSVLSVSNLASTDTLKGVRFEHTVPTSYGSDVKTSVLDQDEFEDLLKAIQLIREKIKLDYPQYYTEIEYTTRTGLTVGGYFTHLDPPISL